MLSTDELVSLIERSTSKTNATFSQALRRIVAAIDPASTEAVELRDSVADLIWRGRKPRTDGSRFSSSFDHVAPSLVDLCHRQLTECTGIVDSRLTNSSVIASRFNDDRSAGREGVARLRATLCEEAALREQAFWRELALVDDVSPTGDARKRLWQTLYNGIVNTLEEGDRAWLQKELNDASNPGQRVIALHGLLGLWERRGRLEREAAELLDAVDDDADLTDIVRTRMAPQTPDPELQEMERENERHRAEAEEREQKRLDDWQAWRARLVADPSDAFAPANRLATISNLHKWLASLDRDRRQFNVWNRSALADVFGADIATQAAKVFQQLWRSESPVLWSTRPVQERNSLRSVWIYGLCGVAAEAELAGWAARLTVDEAMRAVTYAPVELNDFPVWLSDLVTAQTAAVDAVLGSELEKELAMSADEQHLPIVQSILSADEGLKRLLAPRVVRSIAAWPSTFGNDAAGERSARNLEKALRIIEGVLGDRDADNVATECETRFTADPIGPLALAWFRGLFQFSPHRGIISLQSALAGIAEPERPERVTVTLAALFGSLQRFTLNVENADEHAEILGALVRYAHEFVRPVDDQQHEGAYTPNVRDEAERARDFLLSALLDTTGPRAQRILRELAADPLVAQNPDRLRLLARERAAKDAEGLPLIPADVMALDQRYEAPPIDRDELFDVMVDRLDDLAEDVANHDFTDRRTLQTIKDESEMQRTLARRLQDMARGAYVVTRESEVADLKRTDIRLAAVQGGQTATIEVKIADQRWSLAQLERALKEQLVERYLRHETGKAGCLLLTFDGMRSDWKHPQTGTRLKFSEVVEYLAQQAESIEREMEHVVRLGVRGLDLTSPL